MSYKNFAHICKFSVVCAENYENWMTVDKVIAKIVSLTFLAHPVLHMQIC